LSAEEIKNSLMFAVNRLEKALNPRQTLQRDLHAASAAIKAEIMIQPETFSFRSPSPLRQLTAQSNSFPFVCPLIRFEFYSVAEAKLNQISQRN
jgi:hypothetical protein